MMMMIDDYDDDDDDDNNNNNNTCNSLSEQDASSVCFCLLTYILTGCILFLVSRRTTQSATISRGHISFPS